MQPICGGAVYRCAPTERKGKEMHTETDEFRPGRYRHFKGNEYELLYLARHSETREEMVVYRALYGERGVWVRPKQMWNEIVEREGVRTRRFTYIGDE